MSETNVAAPTQGGATVENNEQNQQVSQNAPIEQNKPIEQKPPSKQKYKYKADGQEIEEELGEDEIKNRLSLSRAAQKRMQEAATQAKQFEQFINKLRDNPIEVLNNEKLMGSKKFREIAENFLIQQLEEESMTPEQKNQRDKDNRLKQYEEQEKKRMEAEELIKSQQLEQHWAQHYEKLVMDGLGASEIPKNEFTVKRMAELLQKNIELGLNLEPSQLAQLVKEDYINEHKSLVGSMSAEQYLSMFGNDIADKIRKHDLSKFKATNPKPKQVASEQNSEPAKKMSPREYTEYLQKKWAHTNKE